MANRGTPFAVRVIHAPNHVAIIKAFRAVTDASIGDIKFAVAQQTPIDIGRIFALDHDEVECRILAFLRELDELGTEYEIVVDDETESRECLNNLLQKWRDIGMQTRSMIELETGEPSIDTLEWLRRGSPDVFRQTLRQIVNGDGYHVDTETLQWVERQLDDD